MSAEVQHLAADAAAGAVKRKSEEAESLGQPELKIARTGPPQTSEAPTTTAPPTTQGTPLPPIDLKAEQKKSREIRLEQNRKAARESRRRKKVMIEELQRSVIFFSRANGTLKQQNDDLTRLLIQAQAHIAAMDGTKTEAQAGATPAATEPAPAAPEASEAQPKDESFEQAQAQAVATQAIYESQGFPAAAARRAAQTMSGSSTTTAAPAPSTSQPTATLPPMQPGATMQAMANFQQAAAAAMQAAMQGMQGIPGVNMSQLAATPVGANAQQAYTDTMTALAMQQAAAAAAAGQQFSLQQGFMSHPMVAWSQQQTPQTTTNEPPAEAAPATTHAEETKQE